jgi:hypothetical protein
MKQMSLQYNNDDYGDDDDEDDGDNSEKIFQRRNRFRTEDRCTEQPSAQSG